MSIYICIELEHYQILWSLFRGLFQVFQKYPRRLTQQKSCVIGYMIHIFLVSWFYYRTRFCICTSNFDFLLIFSEKSSSMKFLEKLLYHWKNSVNVFYIRPMTEIYLSSVYHSTRNFKNTFFLLNSCCVTVLHLLSIINVALFVFFKYIIADFFRSSVSGF